MLQTSFNNYGWECPKCGRVYSPVTPQCYYCGERGTTTAKDFSQWKTTTYQPSNETIKDDVKNRAIDGFTDFFNAMTDAYIDHIKNEIDRIEKEDKTNKLKEEK